MARTNKINFRADDAAKIKNIVKRVNAKINYQNKYHPEISQFLPKKENSRSVSSRLKKGTREQFNDYIRQAENFLKKGSTALTDYGGEQIPIFLRKEIKVKLNRINKRRRQMLSQIKVGPELGNIKRVERANLSPKKDFKKSKYSDFNKFLKTVFTQGDINYINNLNRIYKQNFIQSMKNSNFTRKEIQIIRKYLNTFDINEIYLKSLEKEELHLRYVYTYEADENAPENMIKAFIKEFGVIRDLDYGKFIKLL